MSYFKNEEEVYDYIGKVFEIAVNEDEFVKATADSGLVVRLTQTDPDAVILIDFPGRKVTTGDAAAGAPSTVELKMSSDDSHKFWLGKLNLVMAMAKGQVKAKGSVPEMLKMLPLAKPLYARYESILRETGRDDLIRAAG